MNQTYSIFKSRTFWTLVVAGLLPVINLFVPILPVGIQAVVELLLSVLASYFHMDTAAKAGATN